MSVTGTQRAKLRVACGAMRDKTHPAASGTTTLALLDALDEVEAEVETQRQYKREAHQFSEKILRDVADALGASVTDDGYTLVEVVSGIERLRFERDATLARIEKVREALAPYRAHDHDETCDGDNYCGTDVAEEALDALDGEVEA